MLKGKFNLDTLTADDQAVARIVPAGDLFAWMSRSIVVPVDWVALVTRAGRDTQLVLAGEPLEQKDAVDVLFVRTTSITCAVDESELQSEDGYLCRASIRVDVQIMPEPAELAAFRRTVIGSRQYIAMADIERYLHWQMHKVVTELASRHSAAQLIEPMDSLAVRKVADDKLGPSCLAGGLNVVGTVAVHFESPAYLDHCRQQTSLDRSRRRAADRLQIQDALAAAQSERLTQWAGMLERLRDANDAQGDLPLVDLLRAFNETERGQLYTALWHLAPGSRQTRFVAAVSGREILWFDPVCVTKPVRRTSVPNVLGPLRSVRVDAQSLSAGVVLVGAAVGVHLVDIDTGHVRQSLGMDVEDAQKVRGGFNASAMSSDRVFASHSELGLLAWPCGHPIGEGNRSPATACRLLTDLTANASTVRSVQIAEGAVWFTVNEKLWSFSLTDATADRPVLYAGSHTTLSAGTVCGGTVYAGNVEGQILAWDAGDPESVRAVRGPTGSPVESIDVIDAGGVDRLIVADRSSALIVLVAGDNYTCRYESGSLPIRRAVAAEDVFVAMNDNRDRLVVWDPRTPDQPTAAAIVPHMTGDSVQDICLIPKA